MISDIGNNRIFRVSHEGNIHTIAGNATSPASLADQPAKAATLSAPTGVTADTYGNIFFAEQMTGIVREIDDKGNLTRIIGTGSPTEAPVAGGPPLSYPLFSPIALASDGWHSMSLTTAGFPCTRSWQAAPRVFRRSREMATLNTGWTGDGGPALAAGMNPTSVAVNSMNGAVYLADSLLTLDFRNRVRVIQGDVVASFVGGNVPTGQGDNGPHFRAVVFPSRAGN